MQRQSTGTPGEGGNLAVLPLRSQPGETPRASSVCNVASPTVK